MKAIVNLNSGQKLTVQGLKSIVIDSGNKNIRTVTPEQIDKFLIFPNCSYVFSGESVISTKGESINYVEFNKS